MNVERASAKKIEDPGFLAQRSRPIARDVRRRLAPFDVGVPPIEAALPGRALAASRPRVAVMRSGADRDDRVELLQSLATAAHARVEWAEPAANARGGVARALADCDAVVLDTVPLFAAGERALLPRFHSIVAAPSAFGSAVAPRSAQRTDLLLVGAVAAGAAAWERSVRLACAWARDEGRRSVHCAVRDPGWPILASERASRFRRIAAEHPQLAARRGSFQDARRRLLAASHAFETLVCDAGDFDALVRAACAGVGWSNRVPRILVGDDRIVAAVGAAAERSGCVATGETAIAIANVTIRVLRRLGEVGAARRLGDALRAEVAMRCEATRDLWLDLAAETPARFADALLARLAASVPGRIGKTDLS
jgi:hypothetical protein